MRTSCKHHCLGTGVDHYFGMLGLSTPPPPSKACGQLILNIPCNTLSLSYTGLVSYLPKLGSSNKSKIMIQSVEYLSPSIGIGAFFTLLYHDNLQKYNIPSKVQENVAVGKEEGIFNPSYRCSKSYNIRCTMPGGHFLWYTSLVVN